MNQEPFPTHEEFGQMTRVLMEDVERCWDELHAATTTEDQSFWKRAFTRSVFALIEGFCEFFRSKALNAENKKLYDGLCSGEFSFELGVFCSLLGETYFINDDGEIRPQKLHLFWPTFFFALIVLQRRMVQLIESKKVATGWEKIRSAVCVRDNLMHPKNPDSLEIAEKEIDDVVFTWRWFYKEFGIVLERSHRRVS